MRFWELDTWKRENFVHYRVCFGKRFFIFLLLKWIDLWRSISQSLISWVPLGNWKCFKTSVGCRSRDENKLLLARQMVNDGGLTTFMSCKRFRMPEDVIFCFKVVVSKMNYRISIWNFVRWCLFMLWGFLMSSFTVNLQRNCINSFGRDWKESFFLHLRKNDWNAWEVEYFCVFIVQGLQRLQSFGVRSFRGNGSLHKNVIDCLFVVTSQTKYGTQSTMFSYSSNINKNIWTANLFIWIVRN